MRRIVTDPIRFYPPHRFNPRSIPLPTFEHSLNSPSLEIYNLMTAKPDDILRVSLPTETIIREWRPILNL
jgi:hypothetical protein